MDKIVEIRTYIHTDDITYLDCETGQSVFVRGKDRCGFDFAGFMEPADLAPILFPEAS